jgi:hypothetical protein
MKWGFARLDAMRQTKQHRGRRGSKWWGENPSHALWAREKQADCRSALRQGRALNAQLMQLAGDVAGEFAKGGLPIVTTRSAAKISRGCVNVSAHLVKAPAAFHRDRHREIPQSIAKSE